MGCPNRLIKRAALGSKLCLKAPFNQLSMHIIHQEILETKKQDEMRDGVLNKECLKQMLSPSTEKSFKNQRAPITMVNRAIAHLIA